MNNNKRILLEGVPDLDEHLFVSGKRNKPGRELVRRGCGVWRVERSPILFHHRIHKYRREVNVQLLICNNRNRK